MNRHERPLCVAQAEPASRLETAGFSVTGFIAERLAEKGDPNAVDFGMRRLGIDTHSTEAARFREVLLQLAHDLLVRRGELVTQRQRALRDAIAARVIKAIERTKKDAPELAYFRLALRARVITPR